MLFLIDINIIISRIGEKFNTLSDRVLHYSEDKIGLPIIIYHELYFGVCNNQKFSLNLETLRLLLGDFVVLLFNEQDTRVAGEIRTTLGKAGKPIGSYDVLIAGQVKARSLVLVSNNMREFEQISDLQLEDRILS